MFKSARSRLRAAVFVCAAALGLGAYAAPTATAVWRSNLGQSYTIGGNTFAVAPNGGALQEDGTIKMGNENSKLGATIALPAGTRNVSVLVKFSNLSIPTDQQYGTALATINDSSFHEVGVAAANTSSLNTYWHENGSSTYEISAVYSPASPAVVSSGYMLFSYAANTGSRCYMGETIASLAGGENTTGHWSNLDVQYVSIGGPTALQILDICDNLVIEEVALFVGNYLTNTDVADYAFPTLDGETTALTMTELNTKIAADSNVIFTASPVVTLDVEPSDATKTYLQSAAWNGTVLIKDTDKNNIVPTAYGNPNSTLKLSGVKGYFAKAKYGSSSTPAIELEDSETEGRVYGFWNYDGYSFNSYSGYPYVHTPELKGSGSFVADKSSGLKTLLVVDKWSAFTGKLQLAPSGIVCFGTGLPEQTDASSAALTAGSIRLSGTVPASIGTWTVGTAFTGSVVTLTTAANATTTAFLTDSTKWKGTCQLNWNHTSALDIVNYGNANSVVEIVSTFSAYPTKNGGNAAPNLAAELKLSANWTVANGWDNQTTTFAKLSGTGNLIVNGVSSGSSAIPYTITKIENFTGALGGARGQFTIGTIVASEEPVGGTKLVSLSNCTKEPVLTNTTVEYNGNAVEGIALEVKSDGIYVAVPATTVDITIPEVANATVSVTADGVAVTPVNGVVTVDIGAAVVVTYTAAEGYQLTGDAISFTASASTTTVDVSSISVAAIVANVTSADGQTTTPYTSAASAIAAADKGETVTLLEATVTLTEVVAINKSITILSGNASGTTITGSGLSAYPTLGAADLTLGANVTVSAQLRVLSGEATITHPTGSAPSYRPPSGYMSSSKNNGDDTTTITFYQQVYVIAAGTNATLADENGNLLGSYTPVASGDTFVFTVRPAAGCTLVRVTADGAELTPSEGKYSISIGSSNVSIYAVAGAAVVTGGDSDEYCSSLQAAVDAATSGQTVKLLADVTLNSTLTLPAEKTLTMDLGGFTIYSGNDSSKRIVVNGTVTMTNGVVDGQTTVYDPNNGTAMIRVNGSLTLGANLTIRNTINAVAAFGTGSLTVNGATINALGFAISTNGSATGANASNGTVLAINSGTITSTDVAVYLPSGTMTINGGTITGSTGVYAKGGSLSVPSTSTAVITGNGANAGWSFNGNGANSTGDALVIDNSAYPYGPATATIAGGTYESTNGDAIGNYTKDAETLPTATGFVSGGTFSNAVAEEFCAEGFEPTDNDNGTYGVRVDKGWIYEDADFPNYTGSWNKEISYDETTHKAAIEDGAMYTASKPSAGQLVTINLALSFDAANSDDDVHEGAKTAVRLGEGDTEGTYVFQLYTTNETGTAAWLNAAASGVTPAVETDYEFTFVLDMTNKTFTATVDGVALTVDGAETLGFASANASDTVQSIEFTGSGKVSSIEGSYEDVPVPEGFAEDDTFGDVTLTAAQAEWLNGQANYDALAAKIATMDATAFNNAYLLNLDILDESYQDYQEGDFVVTDFAFETESETEYVVVEVTLERHGALDGGINGTLKLTGAMQLGGQFETKASATISDDDFSEGNTATLKLEKSGALFYKPVIE